MNSNWPTRSKPSFAIFRCVLFVCFVCLMFGFFCLYVFVLCCFIQFCVLVCGCVFLVLFVVCSFTVCCVCRWMWSIWASIHSLNKHALLTRLLCSLVCFLFVLCFVCFVCCLLCLFTHAHKTNKQRTNTLRNAWRSTGTHSVCCWSFSLCCHWIVPWGMLCFVALCVVCLSVFVCLFVSCFFGCSCCSFGSFETQ